MLPKKSRTSTSTKPCQNRQGTPSLPTPTPATVVSLLPWSFSSYWSVSYLVGSMCNPEKKKKNKQIFFSCSWAMGPRCHGLVMQWPPTEVSLLHPSPILPPAGWPRCSSRMAPPVSTSRPPWGYDTVGNLPPVSCGEQRCIEDYLKNPAVGITHLLQTSPPCSCVLQLMLQDQKPGTKKCGHMGGKVLVSTQELGEKKGWVHWGYILGCWAWSPGAQHPFERFLKPGNPQPPGLLVLHPTMDTIRRWILWWLFLHIFASIWKAFWR